MALDEATKRIYRRTDSATLIGLLPELRRLGKATQKERERAQQDHPNDDPKFAADLAAYTVATLDRDTWIRNELKRRDLLPLWPDEHDHLENDA